MSTSAPRHKAAACVTLWEGQGALSSLMALLLVEFPHVLYHETATGEKSLETQVHACPFLCLCSTCLFRLEVHKAGLLLCIADAHGNVDD